MTTSPFEKIIRLFTERDKQDDLWSIIVARIQTILFSLRANEPKKKAFTVRMTFGDSFSSKVKMIPIPLPAELSIKKAFIE